MRSAVISSTPFLPLARDPVSKGPKKNLLPAAGPGVKVALRTQGIDVYALLCPT
jgi:hypothetical protein